MHGVSWTPELMLVWDLRMKKKSVSLNPPVQEETASVILKFRCWIVSSLLLYYTVNMLRNGGMALIDNTRRAPRYDERMEAFSINGVKKFGYDPLDETTQHLTADPFIRFADGYR